MFQPGISGNPRGRPKGTGGGRTQTLVALDRLLSTKGNQQAITDALAKELLANPLQFFRNIVVPLLPRAARDAPPPDELDDWQPLERHPKSPPPSDPAPAAALSPYSPSPAVSKVEPSSDLSPQASSPTNALTN